MEGGRLEVARAVGEVIATNECGAHMVVHEIH